MPRLFYGNFDFEETLAQLRPQQRSGTRQRLLAELAPLWMAIARQGDLIWCPRPIEASYFQQLTSSGFPHVRVLSTLDDLPDDCELVPWGWSEEVFQFAQQIGARFSPPPLEVVRQVNSRAFSHALESEAESLDIEVQEVSTVGALMDAVDPWSDQANGWVVKAEFSNSSRERFRHLGGPVDNERLRGWAVKRLAAGQRLYVEPWLDRISEVGLQWEIPVSGPPTLLGVTELLVDSAGRFHGCDFTPGREDDLLWQPVIERTRRAAGRVQSLGYCGPLGIDAMCYRDKSGDIRFRVFQDLNARWTIGRLSLAFRPLLSSGERGCLSQSPPSAYSSNGPGCRTVFSSPEMIHGRPTQLRTMVVINKTS